MKNKRYILVINPGSTSTKVSLFTKKMEECFTKSILHSTEEIKKFDKIFDQKDMRISLVMKWLEEIGVSIEELAGVVGRGGLLRSMPGGTYKVTKTMIEDLKAGVGGEHASNLGGIIARHIADMGGVEAYVVDPVAVDEMEDVSRLSGVPELPRTSLLHALNIKAVTRRVCKKKNLNYEDSAFVVAHLGGGISVAPVRDGRLLDVNNANHEGPFSPERCGTLPVGELVKIAFSGKYTERELTKKMLGMSGLVGYLGTNDGREVDKMIEKGDEKAKLIFEAMAYQIAKEIAGMSVMLFGKIDAIILTGGLAYNERLVRWISDRVKFIAPIEVVPGEGEMEALAEGAIRVIDDLENAKIYEEEVQM